MPFRDGVETLCAAQFAITRKPLLSWHREFSSPPMFNPERVANKIPSTRKFQTSYLFCCAIGSMVPTVILGLAHGWIVGDNQGHVCDYLLRLPSRKVPYYFPCMTKTRSESRGIYGTCLNVHQRSFFDMLTIVSADPPVWPNPLNLRTCDHVWNFRKFNIPSSCGPHLLASFSLGLAIMGGIARFACMAILLWVNLRREIFGRF